MIGETIKVLLPGERLYVEVVEENADTFKGRIINKPYREFSEHEQAQFMKREFGSVETLPELHTFNQDDELWFERGEGNTEGWWVPVLSGER